MKRKFSIAIPASVVSDTPHLREKTSKIGLIGRAAAIFRVNEILVYTDNTRINQTKDISLITTLLAYIETPQYLRRKLFGIKPELQYAGILPPLRTPHHPLKRRTKDLKVGEYREGVVVSKTKEGTYVDIGVEQPGLLLEDHPKMDERITVKIAEVGKKLAVELANRDEIPDYWGFSVVSKRQSIGKIVKSGSYDLTIATSRLGRPFADVAESIGRRWQMATMVLVAFGSPSRGLTEIAKDEGIVIDDIMDFVVNTIPSQGTETVRTEEALIASLAVVNVHFSS